MPDAQTTSGMMENNNIMLVNVSFTIHGRGAISVMPRSLNHGSVPNSVELVLTNSFDEYVFPIEIPIHILFTENGLIGIDKINYDTTSLMTVVYNCITLCRP